MKAKSLSVRRICTTNAFIITVASGSTVDLHKRAHKWMASRASAARPVIGVKLVPFGIEFNIQYWKSKDVWAILERLGIQLA
jgi:hypothetical protein